MGRQAQDSIITNAKAMLMYDLNAVFLHMFYVSIPFQIYLYIVSLYLI